MPLWAIILSALATAGAVYAWSRFLVRYASGTETAEDRWKKFGDSDPPLDYLGFGTWGDASEIPDFCGYINIDPAPGGIGDDHGGSE